MEGFVEYSISICCIQSGIIGAEVVVVILGVVVVDILLVLLVVVVVGDTFIVIWF